MIGHYNRTERLLTCLVALQILLLTVITHVYMSMKPANQSQSEKGDTLSGNRIGAESCLNKLPLWAQEASPAQLSNDMNVGSNGLTDKTSVHAYQHMYHRYLSPIAQKVCRKDQSNTVRILEIGLGCAPRGGMIDGIPGGSALAWNYLFPNTTYDLQLHVMEYDEKCGRKWAVAHENYATVHYGDQSNSEDLKRVVAESGNVPFDIIIDDGSHINSHQIASLNFLINAVGPSGVYIIEDIQSACTAWKANMGFSGLRVQGTPGCMHTESGEPTILTHLLNLQKKLVMNQNPYKDVTHIDICFEAAVLQKEIL